MVDKNSILDRIDTMDVIDIVRAIMDGEISFEEIKESGKLDEAKLKEISRILSTLMPQKRRFEERRRPRGSAMEFICFEKALPDSAFVFYDDSPVPPKKQIEEDAAPIILPLPFHESVGKTQTLRREDPDIVYSALYAPASARVGIWFKVQVHLYGKLDAEKVNEKALAMDKDATLNEYNPLSINIGHGTQVKAEIHVYDDGVRVRKSEQSLVWNGEMISTVFHVMSSNPDVRSIVGDVTLSVKGFPVGELSFNTEIVQEPMENAKFVLGKAKGFRKAFISYSHMDIDTAEITASILDGLGLDYFMDRRSLGPGAVFDDEIRRNIKESDLFILLWSQNAAESDYVEKEYLYALPFAYPQEPKEKATIEFRPYLIKPHAEAPAKLKGIYNFAKMHLG